MFIAGIDKFRIILASRSPRRQQLLLELGLKFDVVVKEYDEIYPAGISGEEIARYIAHQKALLFKNEIKSDEIVITADTIVWCNNKVLGKPSDNEEAKQILREISGRTHEVITGVSLFSISKEKIFSESTKVTFGKLSEEEISYYVHNYRPLDKAGAYGIQEWIGIAACSHIEGSYFNVVGLPAHRLYKELQIFIK
jgi:septum formation protein